MSTNVMTESGVGDNRERWRLMEEIYHAALPLTVPERQRFVAQRCGSDPALNDEVNSLLEADDRVAGFLEKPISELGMAVLADEALRDTEILSQPFRPVSDNLTLTKVANRYEVIKRLGAGGFGEVYKAADSKVMSRPVIIKVLKEEVLRSDDAKRDWVVTKFKQEIEALAKIDDPGVVRIFDADTLPDRRPYIVMEFVEGSDLRQFIRDSQQVHVTGQGLRFQDVAEIVSQAGRTLTAAHEVGIFHRDLKPENIMLRRNASRDLQVKVIDFGIAKVRDSLIAPSTESGLVVAGTLQYMAPEQLLGKKVDEACDIYALGVISYEMLTGRYPFPTKDPVKLKEMQEAGVKFKPCDLNPDLPAAAQEAILKALEYYPAERHRRARDFGDELAHALMTEEELVRPAPRVGVSPEVGSPIKENKDGRNEEAEAFEAQLKPAPYPPSWWSLNKRWIYAASALLLTGLISLVAWRSLKRTSEGSATTQQSAVATPAAAPERSLTLWLHVLEPKGDGTFGEFDSTGEEAFKVGSKIYFRVHPAEDGYLYIINEGEGESGTKKWTAVFPNPKDNNKSPRLKAGRLQEITGMTLDDNPGDETIHLVWAESPVTDLEPLFRFEFNDNDKGVFGAPEQQNALREFFQRNRETSGDKIFENGASPRVTVKGRGSLIVGSLTVKHRKYGN